MYPHHYSEPEDIYTPPLPRRNAQRLGTAPAQPAPVAMPVFPLRPASTTAAAHYSPYSPSRFHIDKRCQHRCSWKCCSFALILLCVVLTAMLAYFGDLLSKRTTRYIVQNVSRDIVAQNVGRPVSGSHRLLVDSPCNLYTPASNNNPHYAVIAAGCASCPKIKCERPGCDSYFCYHCKAGWHPNQTCDAARAQRSPNVRSSSISFSQDSQHRDDIKPCPRCQVLIVKMDDGSCNHMTCAVCGAEFCWLCMKEISDLHYLSPSGCTFWGKKPWSRKKKILWQLGTLVGAPVGIGLVAGIAVPAIIIGIPVWVGRKLYTRYEHANKHKRNLAIASGVTASVLISPVLAGLAVGIGVPILLFYVYGVVPVSLCRSGGCGVTTSGTGVRFEFDDENDILGVMTSKPNDGDTVSHPGGNPSIGEVSLSLGSGSQLEREPDRESASLAGLSGSIAGANRLDVQAEVASTQRFSMSSETASATTSLSEKSLADDGGASVRALAGSVLNFKMDSGSLSNYRTATGSSNESSTPVEVHIETAAIPQRSEPNVSLSSLEELASGLMRRVAHRRLPLDRQTSDSGDEVGLERVRFDDHVSFIDLNSERHCKAPRKHLQLNQEQGASSSSSSNSSNSSSGCNNGDIKTSRTTVSSSLRSLFFHQLAESRSNSGGHSSEPPSKHMEHSLPAIPEPPPLTSDSVVIAIP